MDDPSFYGFPSYGEAPFKAAQDCGGAVTTADTRSYDVDPDALDRLRGFADLAAAGPRRAGSHRHAASTR